MVDQKLLNHKLLNHAQEVRLAKTNKAKLARYNQRLVVSIAQKYLYKGLSLQELVQEGNVGLMKAINRYDYKRGYRFSTYAVWWIRKAIQTAVYKKQKTYIESPLYDTTAYTQHNYDHLLPALLDTLPPKQRKIIDMRFGITGDTHTLKEVGKMFDLSYERIRQIEKEGLISLRQALI